MASGLTLEQADEILKECWHTPGRDLAVRFGLGKGLVKVGPNKQRCAYVSRRLFDYIEDNLPPYLRIYSKALWDLEIGGLRVYRFWICTV